MNNHIIQPLTKNNEDVLETIAIESIGSKRERVTALIDSTRYNSMTEPYETDEVQADDGLGNTYTTNEQLSPQVEVCVSQMIMTSYDDTCQSTTELRNNGNTPIIPKPG